MVIQNTPNPNSALYVSTNGTGKAFHVSGKTQLDGNVTIGDAFTNYQLNVNGTVKSREVVVTTTNFPDYVFDDDYDLMGLSDLEQVIRQEGLLPGIPSADEVASSGIGIGDMQTRLLEKIEELTLYTIEQEKEFDALRSQFADIQNGVGAKFMPFGMTTSAVWALLGGLAVVILTFGVRRFIMTAKSHQ